MKVIHHATATGDEQKTTLIVSRPEYVLLQGALSTVYRTIIALRKEDLLNRQASPFLGSHLDEQQMHAVMATLSDEDMINSIELAKQHILAMIGEMSLDNTYKELLDIQ